MSEATAFQESPRDGDYEIVEEIKTSKEGKKVKVVKKIQRVQEEVKLNKNVEERKVLTWRKFGRAREIEGDSSVTSRETVQFEHTAKDSKQQNQAQFVDKNAILDQVKNELSNLNQQLSAKDETSSTASSIGFGRENRDRDLCTVKVSNLSEEVTENDLEFLFRKAGIIRRVYLARYAETRTSKGFAFITYGTPEEAQKAIQLFNGKSLERLIMTVEPSQ